MLLFDQVSFARHMASVSQTTSGMAGKPEMLEQLQHLRGVHYKPGSKGIVMVGGGAKVLGNALVSRIHPNQRPFPAESNSNMHRIWLKAMPYSST
jgi:hypothetical protein